jgi:hypothetical protein
VAAGLTVELAVAQGRETGAKCRAKPDGLRLSALDLGALVCDAKRHPGPQPFRQALGSDLGSAR